MIERQIAIEMDNADPLRAFRAEFYFPTDDAGNELIYLCGNSLGLQPKAVSTIVNEELDDWAKLGVEGHFRGRRPWFDYHKLFVEPLARIVGAQPNEVVTMNSLTTNLHLLMVSFYRPTKARFKILIEGTAFPSDQYAVASQARFHGYDPKDAIVEMKPRQGEKLIRTEDVETYLQNEGESVALVLFGGVNYYTGQAFDFERITKAGHAAGAIVGFDLAHAAGNLELQLHDWDVDFAVWCSYKYLNSGPGGVGGAFVHQRFENDQTLPRFHGWWGNDPKTRFQMGPEFESAIGADGWQLSNAPVLALAAHKASLDLFDRAGIQRLRKKSVEMTEFLLQELDTIDPKPFEVITPRDAKFRGSQLSLRALESGEALFKSLTDANVVCDFRKPDVVRIAPVPLYNSFEDLWEFCDVVRRSIA